MRNKHYESLGLNLHKRIFDIEKKKISFGSRELEVFILKDFNIIDENTMCVTIGNILSGMDHQYYLNPKKDVDIDTLFDSMRLQFYGWCIDFGKQELEKGIIKI